MVPTMCHDSNNNLHRDYTITLKSVYQKNNIIDLHVQNTTVIQKNMVVP